MSKTRRLGTYFASVKYLRQIDIPSGVFRANERYKDIEALESSMAVEASVYDVTLDKTSPHESKSSTDAFRAIIPDRNPGKVFAGRCNFMNRLQTSNQIYGSHLYDVMFPSSETYRMMETNSTNSSSIHPNDRRTTMNQVIVPPDHRSPTAPRPLSIRPLGRFRPTSHDYGSRSPSDMHRSDRYFPKTNTFSKSFAGRQRRSEGLITSCSKSRIHAQLDEFH